MLFPRLIWKLQSRSLTVLFCDAKTRAPRHSCCMQMKEDGEMEAKLTLWKVGCRRAACRVRHCHRLILSLCFSYFLFQLVAAVNYRLPPEIIGYKRVEEFQLVTEISAEFCPPRFIFHLLFSPNHNQFFIESFSWQSNIFLNRIPQINNRLRFSDAFGYNRMSMCVTVIAIQGTESHRAARVGDRRGNMKMNFRLGRLHVVCWSTKKT